MVSEAKLVKSLIQLEYQVDRLGFKGFAHPVFSSFRGTWVHLLGTLCWEWDTILQLLLHNIQCKKVHTEREYFFAISHLFQPYFCNGRHIQFFKDHFSSIFMCKKVDKSAFLQNAFTVMCFFKVKESFSFTRFHVLTVVTHVQCTRKNKGAIQKLR